MAGSSSFTVPILESNNFDNWSVPILESNNFDNWLFRLTTLFKRDQCEEALEAPPVETDSIEIKNKFQRADAKAHLKLGVNEKLEDHFFKFDTIIRELKESGSNIDESDKVCHLLLSLPSKFDTVVTALETIPAVKIDFVKSRLLDEEIKAKSKQEGKSEEK
ncbi:hypothetical protein QE152_g31933 [Popillia japonica]|uniref:Uncharacterized protein n=1 Tax=Popillia japonica TaxID=7064 RepID=A0AAW1J0W2_POPJA